MAVDLNALAQATLTANALSGLVLATPQSVGYQPQAPAVSRRVFLFDYEGENSISLESDITDHFVEDNTALQDQIALKPTIVGVTGYIGELNNVLPPELQALKTIADSLTLIQAYVPSITASALIAYNTAFQAYQVAASLTNSAVAAWEDLTKAPANDRTTSKQQVAYQRFFGYWQNRTLFTIQTPWAVFKDMAIMRLRAVQDEDTRVISSFEISFKELRFAQTQQGGNALFQGRATAQAQTTIDKGVGNLGRSKSVISAVI